MEDLFYNILWIDDEHETLAGTKGRAKRNNINLIPFKSLNSGIDELEKNYSFYDGILLDAKFFENEDDQKGSEDTFNVHRAKERILQIKKKFEVFILTGQAEAYADTTFNKAFAKVYKKGSDQEMDRLFGDIKGAASTHIDTQTRHQYSRVFRVIKRVPALQKHEQTLLDLLKNKETNKDYANIRKVFESLFVSLSEIHIIPEGFTEETGWINGTSKFISGYHYDYEFYDKEFIHPTICETLNRILNMVQDGSHNEGRLKHKVDEYDKMFTSGYLFKSIIYGFLEIICYFGELIEKNQDKKVNQSRWKKKELRNMEDSFIEAIFQSINTSNWGRIKCNDGREVDVHPKAIEKYRLAIGEIIWVSLEFNKEKNKYHIINIKKNNG